MAEVTLGFDELEDNDLPPVCMACGARRGVDFVGRTFVWSPLFAPPLLKMVMTKRVNVEIPLCPEHGGPRLFAYRRFHWWGLKTVAVAADRITIGGVHEDFVEALHRWREKAARGETDEPRRRGGRVEVRRGPGGTGTTLKVFGILIAVMIGLVAVGVVGMLVLMAVGLLLLPKAPPRPAPPTPVAVAAGPKQVGNAVALLGVAPPAVGPAALPWAPLAMIELPEMLKILDDAELDRLLTDLASWDPNTAAAAARRLAKATPTEARRKEAAAALAAATANPFPSARQAAAGLGVWGTADDVPALARMLADPFPDVKSAAVAALAGMKDPKAAAAVLPELEKAARDPNPNVARAAADAAKAVRDRRNLEAKQP